LEVSSKINSSPSSHYKKECLISFFKLLFFILFLQIPLTVVVPSLMIGIIIASYVVFFFTFFFFCFFWNLLFPHNYYSSLFLPLFSLSKSFSPFILYFAFSFLFMSWFVFLVEPSPAGYTPWFDSLEIHWNN